MSLTPLNRGDFSNKGSNSYVPGACTQGANPAALPASNGLFVQRQAYTQDGFDGGVRIVRDASSLSGGGLHVNTALHVETIVGANEQQFEFNALFTTHNYSSQGEHTGLYSKGIKWGTGPTWGACIEFMNPNGMPGAGLGLEITYGTIGYDTGDRIGLDIVLGDARAGWGFPTEYVTEGTVGVRVGPSSGAKRPGENVTYPKWTFGFQLIGKAKVGLSFSDAELDTGTAIRMKEGQLIAFEGTDHIRMRFKNGRIQMLAGSTPIFEVDMGSGDIYKKGVKVL